MSQKKQEVKFDCQGCGRLVTGREYHPHLYCKLHKLGLLDQVMQLIKDRDAKRETASVGHWYAGTYGPDVKGFETGHRCNCGYEAKTAESINQHVIWKLEAIKRKA